MRYRQAYPADLKEIQELLESYELPSGDCSEHLSNFVIAENGNGVVGVGGFETCGRFGLLRSFAVKNGFKGQSVASEIFSLAKARAIDLGIHRFYLLTTTARGFFERFGFSMCDREDVPGIVKKTKQFDELCPTTATVMVLSLAA